MHLFVWLHRPCADYYFFFFFWVLTFHYTMISLARSVHFDSFWIISDVSILTSRGNLMKSARFGSLGALQNGCVKVILTLRLRRSLIGNTFTSDLHVFIIIHISICELYVSHIFPSTLMCHTHIIVSLFTFLLLEPTLQMSSNIEIRYIYALRIYMLVFHSLATHSLVVDQRIF